MDVLDLKIRLSARKATIISLKCRLNWINHSDYLLPSLIAYFNMGILLFFSFLHDPLKNFFIEVSSVCQFSALTFFVRLDRLVTLTSLRSSLSHLSVFYAKVACCCSKTMKSSIPCSLGFLCTYIPCSSFCTISQCNFGCSHLILILLASVCVKAPPCHSLFLCCLWQFEPS